MNTNSKQKLTEIKFMVSLNIAMLRFLPEGWQDSVMPIFIQVHFYHASQNIKKIKKSTVYKN